MKVLVTGGKGQLGTMLQAALAGHDVLGVDLPEVDIASYAAARQAVDGFGPDAIIHAAALTDVDGCERDPELAYRINTLGTQNVALAARAVGAKLVAISTDFVFDGLGGAPYWEYDEPNPISVYGRSKLAGERYAQTLNDRTFVVRPAWMFSGVGKSFARTMLRITAERAEVTVVDDEVGTPTYAPDLAAALARVIESEIYGTYHITNDGSCSRYEFVSELVRLAGRPTRVVPVSSAEYLAAHPLPAKRPPDSRLRNFAAATALGIRLRSWQDAMAEMIRDLPQGS